MKLNIGLILAIVVLAVVVVFQAVQISSLKNDVQLWGKMADIGFETLHQERLNRDPIQREIAEYIESHNGSPPPASWYRKGDLDRVRSPARVVAMVDRDTAVPDPLHSRSNEYCRLVDGLLRAKAISNRCLCSMVGNRC